MSDEITELRSELAALRREVDFLRQRLGTIGNIEPDQPNYHLGHDASYLRTQAATIYDHKGGPMVEIRAEEDTAGIYLRDGKGRCHASFQLNSSGPRLEFRSPQRSAVVSLSNDKEGHGTIYVASPDGKPRAILRSTQLGGTVAVVPGNATKPSAFLLASDKGGVLELSNTRGKVGVSAHAKDEGGYIRCHENSGQTMAMMMANVETGAISVSGPQGEDAGTLAASEQGGFLEFYDVNGDPKTRLPQ